MQRINSDLGEIRVIHHVSCSGVHSIKLGTKYDQFIITPGEAVKLANDLADVLDRWEGVFDHGDQ